MPKLVPQHLKAESTVAQQPQQMSSRIVNIIYMDIAGLKNQKISELTGLGEVRVSIIKNSPLYQQQKSVVEEQIRQEVIEKHTDKMTAGDPVESLIKEKCLEAAEKKIWLMNGAKSEMVQSQAASDILGIGGYMKKTSKTTTVIEVDSKMASRWERVLNDKEKPRVKITQEEVTEE